MNDFEISLGHGQAASMSQEALQVPINLAFSCRDLLGDKQGGRPEVTHFADVFPVEDGIHLPDLWL